MVTKTLRVSESAYAALTAHKRPGESFSDVILRVTEGDENGVCGFLQTIDPALRTEIAEAVTSAKKDLDHARQKKISL